MSSLDKFIVDFDTLLRIMTGSVNLKERSRPNPASYVVDDMLNSDERLHSANLMRINHVGEVCAQALYSAQGRFAQEERIIQQLSEAAKEEQDHQVWTAERLRELY
jgi:ubiquinone biosynthesis monooxygenase Coq7